MRARYLTLVVALAAMGVAPGAAGARALLGVTAAPLNSELEPLQPSFKDFVEEEQRQARPSFSYCRLAHEFLRSAHVDPAAYEKSMQQLLGEFKEHLAKHSVGDAPQSRCEALRRFLFGEKGFRADLDLSQLDNLYPDRILNRKRGYCLGLTLVILDLGERLGWPLVAGAAPRHIFVRYPLPQQVAQQNVPDANSASHINIETTRSGELYPDSWYRENFGLQVRTATGLEIAAHLLNNHGFVLLTAEQEGADQEFADALALFPGLTEARINQGVWAARRGKFEQALKAFEKVTEEWPQDVEVQLNRVNALSALDRHLDALRLLTEWVDQGTDVERLRRTVEGVRAHVDATEHWTEIQQLSVRFNQRLAKSTGSKPGLRGRYYGDTKLQRFVLERIDEDLAFQWNWDSPDRRIPKDQFSARWDGWLEIPKRDKYNFWFICSDGIRVWIDGVQVLNGWRRANDNSVTADVVLEPGRHDLRVEYFETVGEAGIKCFFTAESEDAVLDFSRFLSHPAR